MAAGDTIFHRERGSIFKSYLTIPKPDKDAKQPSSYRPIPLINLHVKIMSKIVKDRLATVLLTIIHPSKTGFVRGRSAPANI